MALVTHRQPRSIRGDENTTKSDENGDDQSNSETESNGSQATVSSSTSGTLEVLVIKENL